MSLAPVCSQADWYFILYSWSCSTMCYIFSFIITKMSLIVTLPHMSEHKIPSSSSYSLPSLFTLLIISLVIRIRVTLGTDDFCFFCSSKIVCPNPLLAGSKYRLRSSPALLVVWIWPCMYSLILYFGTCNFFPVIISLDDIAASTPPFLGIKFTNIVTLFTNSISNCFGKTSKDISILTHQIRSFRNCFVHSIGGTCVSVLQVISVNHSS